MTDHRDARAPALLMAAPNGGRKTKADHPHLPMTPEEAAAEAEACVAAGARAIHIHARDAAGAHTLDPDISKRFLHATADAVGDAAVVQMTTEAAGRYTPLEMIASVKAMRPEATSVAVRELFPPEDRSGDGAAADFLHWAVGEGIGLQFIFYAAEDATRFRQLRAKGLIPDDGFGFLLALGKYADLQRATPEHMRILMTAFESEPEPWMVAAFGPEEQACVLGALAFGGHGRLGFENNDVLASGEQAENNSALILQTAGLLASVGRRLATAEEARLILRVRST